VKSPTNVPSESVKDIKETLMTPGQNYGKDRYTIDLTGSEATYCLRTESGLLGVFHFDGSCTAGDGSCYVRLLSMGVVFCNLNSLERRSHLHLPGYMNKDRTSHTKWDGNRKA
jgi:hypothetical protein